MRLENYHLPPASCGGAFRRGKPRHTHDMRDREMQRLLTDKGKNERDYRGIKRKPLSFVCTTITRSINA